MEQRYTTFSLLLINISRCVQKIKNVEMAALGLKGKQVQCLFGLYNYKNPIRLTEKGEHIARIVAEKISSILEEGGAGISDDERSQLYHSLGIISENLTEICGNYAREQDGTKGVS